MADCQDAGEPVLVALAQSGDQDAFEVLLRRYYRPLRAFRSLMQRNTSLVLQALAALRPVSDGTGGR